MAVSVAVPNEDLLARSLRKVDTERQRSGTLGDFCMKSRLKTFGAWWEHLRNAEGDHRSHATKRHARTALTANKQSTATRELFRPYCTALPFAVPPPTYEESIQDLPPDYTDTDGQAIVQLCLITVEAKEDDSIHAQGHWNEGKPCSQPSRSGKSASEIDWSQIEGVRSHANKKAKQAAKKAQQDKWADSDNEDKQSGGADGGDGGDNGGGDGGSGAGGDAPDGSGGGDDADDWGGWGSSKKDKKKKKKNAWLEEEEDADKKAEEAKKAEEEANGNGAAEADPLDDWGAFATVGKKKKGKKGKAELDEPIAPEPETKSAWDTLDLGTSATADANADDDWGGFTTGKKKKTKKGKNDVAADSTDKDMKFDDVNLNDDKNAPKLDLDFGLDAAADKKATGGGFSFGGGWGGGWGSTNSWGFGGADKKEEAKEVKAPADDAGWNFASTSSKKDKKKKDASGFDFNFDGIGDEGDAALDLGAIAKPDKASDDKPAEDDPWASFGTKKDKKKSKKGAIEPDPIAEVLPPPPAAAPTADEKLDDDPWSGLMSGKKEKKSKKKNFWDEEAEATPAAAPDPPKEEKREEEDIWSFGASSKKKTSKKSSKTEDKVEEVVPEPAPEPPAAPLDDFDGFGMATSKKDKKKKKATFDYGSPDPDPIPEPPAAPPAAAATEQDDWLGAGWGDTSKKTKKSKKGTLIEEVAPAPPPAPEPIVEEKADDDWFYSGATSKKDKKSSKKGKVEPETVPSPPPAVLEEPKVEEDDWMNTWSSGKKDKKKSSKKDVAPPPAPTPPDQGLDDSDPLDLDDPWASLTKSKSTKSSPKDKKATLSRSNSTSEVPKTEDSKLSKSKLKDSKSKDEDVLGNIDELEFEGSKDDKKTSSKGWGTSLWGSSSDKTKTKTSSKETDKERRDREKKEQAEADDKKKADDDFAALLGDDLDLLSDEVPKKSSKDAKDSKKKSSDKTSSKSDSKSSKKEESPPPVEPVAADVVDNTKKADGWGFWGSSLKSGSKTATSTADNKKEIGSGASTNRRTSLTDQTKIPETTAGFDDVPSKSSTRMKSSTTKAATATSSSVAERIKALQGDKESGSSSSARKAGKDASSVATPPSPPADPNLEFDLLDDRKSSKKSSSAVKTSSTSKRDKKDSSLVADPVTLAPPKSTSPLPGGFPNDDLFDSPVEHMASPPKKSSSKDKKSSTKTSKREATIVEAVPEIDLLGDDTKLPTPPPERSSKTDAKLGKKERPSVVRDQQSSSWGTWGAAPAPAPAKTKKSSKEVSDGDASPTEKRPSLSRSKSERKASEKAPVEKGSKSSDSDKDPKSSKSRPSTSRGMSFGGLFGSSNAATPSRSKSTRDPRDIKESRRRSVVPDSGLMSPPPDDAKPKDISDKAAKVLGVKSSKSTRDKTRTRKSPDADLLEDDDLVMVDADGDDAKEIPQFDIPKKEKKRPGKTRRHSTMMSGGLGEADDEAMVDAPRVSDESAEFVKRPSPVRRSTTTPSSTKKGGLMGGIFGALGGRPTPDRRQSKLHESEDGSARRKRDSVYEDDSAKRLRREERRVGRTSKAPDADRADSPLDDAAEAEAKEARRAERRARKEREAAEEEAKANRKREKEEARKVKEREERERLAREDEERQARRQEERKARRAEREARHAEEDRVAAEEEARIAERRERRREREKTRDIVEETVPIRSKPDRRQSYMEDPEEQEARRLRREDRLHRRTTDVTAGAESKDRPRASRRRSDYPAQVDSYFDKRNGEHTFSASANRTPLADGRAFTKVSNGNDKTANWVNSVNSDPPPPPPIEGTILDGPAYGGEEHVPMDETTARELKRNRRQDRERYGDEEDRDSRRRRDIRDSDGSSHGRRQSYAGYADPAGGRSWDARPGNPRRGSWFKRVAGL